MRATLRVCGMLFWGLGVLGTVSTTPSAALTFDEAIKTALETHPKVHGASAGVRAASEDVDIERAGFLPSLDFKAASGYENVNNSTTRGRAARTNGSVDPNVTTLHKEGGITASQILFDGFDTWLKTDAAQKRLSAARFQLLEAKEGIALKAAQAYLEALRTRETVRLSEENVERHAKVFEDIKGKAAQGASSTADVRQSQNRLFAARSRTVQAKGSVREADARFREVIGTAPAELSDPADLRSSVPETAEDIMEGAFKSNPSLMAARQIYDSRDADADASNAAYLPTVTLELGSARKQDVAGVRGMVVENTAMVVMRYNLYHGGRDQARSQKATELKSQALHREGEVRRQIEQQIRTDASAFQVAKENTPIFREKVTAASEVLAAYQQQFDLGRRSLLDLLDAEDDLFNAKISLLNAELSVLDAQYRLMADMGSLAIATGNGPGPEEKP